MNEIKIDSKKIGKSNPCFTIAEAGANHDGEVKKALKLIDSAIEAKADSIKFQTYKAHLNTSKYAKSYWDTKKEKTKSQFELFKKYDLFEEKHYKELSNYCKRLKIEFISTPFDIQAVDMLDKLVKFFKISSSDITNFPLLKKIASKKKIKLIIFISLVAKIVFENTGNIDSLKHIKAAIIVKLSPP